MDSKKVLEVIELYRRDFKSMGLVKIEFSHSDIVEMKGHVLDHCYEMLDQIESLAASGKIDEARQRLGFVQGCLWSAGIYTLEDLKNHNRQN